MIAAPFPVPLLVKLISAEPSPTVADKFVGGKGRPTGTKLTESDASLSRVSSPKPVLTVRITKLYFVPLVKPGMVKGATVSPSGVEVHSPSSTWYS